jgi:hypothetical protein
MRRSQAGCADPDKSGLVVHQFPWKQSAGLKTLKMNIESENLSARESEGAFLKMISKDPCKTSGCRAIRDFLNTFMSTTHPDVSWSVAESPLGSSDVSIRLMLLATEKTHTITEGQVAATPLSESIKQEIIAWIRSVLDQQSASYVSTSCLIDDDYPARPSPMIRNTESEQEA